MSLPWLAGLARRWEESGAGTDVAPWQQAHEPAGHMLRTWPKTRHGSRPGEPQSDAARMLAVLTQLKDAARIDAFVADVATAGAHGQSDNEALLQAAALLAPQQSAALIERIVQANAASDLGACADLLARAAAASAAAGSTRSLVAAARAVIDVLPGDPARAPQQPADAWPRPQGVDAGVVVDLLMALEPIDTTLGGQAVDHLLAWPAAYGLDAFVLPAVRRLSAQATTHGDPGVQRLRAACVGHLRPRTAEPFEAPADWSRAAALDCRCAHCTELARFLASSDQRAWTFKAAEASRAHVTATVQRCRCDLDLVTERYGRPYGLVCITNQASHDRRTKQRCEDREDLARLG